MSMTGQPESTTPATPEGWYPDAAAGKNRWWDGEKWTNAFQEPVKTPGRALWSILSAVIAVVVFFIGIGIGLASAPKTTPASDGGYVTQATGGPKAGSPAPSVAAEPATMFGDGEYLVGTEVAPGTYKTTTASDTCYAATMDSANNILDNDISSGSSVFIVPASAYSIKVTGCGTFNKVG